MMPISMLRAALRLPVIRELREAGAARTFRRAPTAANYFFGVYGTFEEAEAAVPAQAAHSYDTGASGRLYRDRLAEIFPHDYPVLYWLKPMFSERVRRVFDLGGHVGIANYSYERYLGSLDAIEWKVCDLPAIVEAGRELAASRGRRGLSFTTRYEDADGADVLLASGVLQYLRPGFLGGLLARLSRPPRDVFVNLLPSTKHPTFCTLNNVRTAICPYVVVNEKEFVASLEGLGYELVDAWSSPEKRCVIPLHPERTVEAYRGFYFRKRALP
ncbi:MAG TPA: methyltransferase, TIGR04325 family [Polyangiaceae bacterium]|jgi:putative methyltransferase (TIGR04325 family)